MVVLLALTFLVPKHSMASMMLTPPPSTFPKTRLPASHSFIMACDVTTPAHESLECFCGRRNLYPDPFSPVPRTRKFSAVFRTLRPKMLKTVGLTGPALAEASSLMLSCVSLLQLPNLSGFLTDKCGACFPQVSLLLAEASCLPLVWKTTVLGLHTQVLLRSLGLLAAIASEAGRRSS